MDADSFIDYEENDNYAFFLIAEPTEVEKYTKVLDENLIDYYSKNISKDILIGKFDVKNFISPDTISFNSLRYKFFIEDLDDWIYNNLDIDTILDRISDIGIKSLTDVEREFLKNYNL